MIYRIETQTPMGEIAQKLPEAAKAEGFGVLHVFELPAIIRSKGFDYPGEVTVFEICSPKYAFGVLSDDPAASVYLPCRISVAEAGGTRVLSTPDLEATVRGDTLSPETVKTHLADVFGKIKKIMAQL